MDQIRNHIQRNQIVYISMGFVALGFYTGYRAGTFVENVRIGLRVNDHVRIADAAIVFFEKHPELEKQFIKEIGSKNFWPSL